MRNALSADRISSDDSRLRANWRAVHAFNRVTSNEINKKMKTLIRSINRSPLRCGFFTLAIALCWFALSPPLKAAIAQASVAQVETQHWELTRWTLSPPGSTIPPWVPVRLLPILPAIITWRLVLGRFKATPLASKHGHWGGGAQPTTYGNFNMAIGFRVVFMNTTGSRNSGVGAAALRNNDRFGQYRHWFHCDEENTTGDLTRPLVPMRSGKTQPAELNVAVGDSALTSFNGTDAGIDGANTALGSIALTALTSGYENMAVGRRALQFATSGNNNIAVGGVPAMALPRAMAIPFSAPKPAQTTASGRIITLFFSASQVIPMPGDPDNRSLYWSTFVACTP